MLSDLSPAELDSALATLEAMRFDRLPFYRPYPKQLAFHDAGATFRERLLRAGNQQGKTYTGAAEMAMHLTGEYPDWWRGWRFDGPIIAWATGVTGETTRDNPQRALLGIVGEMGTGAVPARTIADTAAARGIADLLDYAKIRHSGGGVSTLRFKYYEQGREKWQGPPVDLVWFDEEPPPDIYSEGMARTIATGGRAFMTFTPLKGMSDVVRQFLMSPDAGKSDTNMTIDDAEHIPAAERERIIASFPEHEREARAKGIPVLGSGRVFPVAESAIMEEQAQPETHWCRVVGLDFGWDHPTAAVWLAWDRDADVIHVYDAYRARAATPIIHAAAIRARGDWIPAAWPHDGLQHDKGSGQQIAELYRQQGVAMLHEKACFDDGSNGVEAGVQLMLQLMQTGRLKVARHLTEWWEEFRLYHRKDGQIVKEGDDLMSATRYAIMMRRFAQPEPWSGLRAGESYRPPPSAGAFDPTRW